MFGNKSAWWNSDLSIKFLKYHFANRINPDDNHLLLWDDLNGDDQESASRKIAALRKKIDNEKFALVAPSRSDIAK
ncbi:hypothetical protein PHMEG_00041335 [Phytophthora megakarya]|uniref:Uncharacterized protein n=1 Tax=Phytophthora megakarya TaxID=4795 RepID=A0A225UBW0_9STRA|nr:hypothetical protein PHMEG_00041335 [Phytophthora megakarya]